MRIVLAAACALLLGPIAGFADTLVLKGGVRLHGDVSRNEHGHYVLKTGGRTMTYRATDVLKFDKNAGTAAERQEEAVARRARVEKELLEKTGLTVEQRSEIHRLLSSLRSSDRRVIHRAMQQLIALNQKVDVAGYLESGVPSMSPQLAPNTMEVVAKISPPKRAIALFRDQAHALPVPTRVKAIKLLGRFRDRHSVDLFISGLVDGDDQVVAASARALGMVETKRATPALIHLLINRKLSVGSACREALESIWKSQLDEDHDIDTGPEWLEFWEKHEQLVYNPVVLAEAKPLVAPGNVYEDE